MDDDEAVDVTSMDTEPPQPDEAEDASSLDPEPLQPDEAKDFTSFNPESRQLSEVSPMGLNTRPEHVQGMFKQWFSLPETRKMINSLIANALAGAPINALGNPVNVDAGGSSSSSSTFPGTSAPPLQHRSLSSSPHIPEQSNSPFNPESLQLSEVSSMGLNTRPEHVQGMFKQWFSLPETRKMMNSLIANALAGASINALGIQVNVDAGGSSSSSSTFPGTSAPPLQPRSLSSSPHIPEQSNSPLSLGFPSNLVHHTSQELKEQFISRIKPIFNNPLRGLLIYQFKTVTKEVCKLPSFFSPALFRRIDSNSSGLVTRDALIKYWVDGNMLTMNTATQTYKILKHPGREYLTQVDFEPILEEILATHPGLDFLQAVPDSQDVYTKTVIYRIFYKNDRSASGRLTLRNLKRGGDLIDAMQQLDEEDDINAVQRYFAYKHVLIINTTFWSLASDDSTIEIGDLIRYADYSLSERVVDRIFSEAPREFTCGIPGKMDYEDFVYFLLSEEDKTTESSIEYWFKCLDLDGNEKITPDEMKFFYEEQMIRMRFMGHEPVVSFEDMLCQIIDMIAPERKDYITLRDFKRSKLSGNVFNTLFNLRKYIESCSKEKSWLRKKEEEEHPDWTEWDHFVHIEFAALNVDTDDEEEDDRG